jgi:hypothetical protein
MSLGAVLRERIACPEGLGNRVAAIANALTWTPRIGFEWVINEHCPLPWTEVFPRGIRGVDFLPGNGSAVSEFRGVPAMDWGACRCHHHAAMTYRRVMGAMRVQADPAAPAVAIVARFHRAEGFDIGRLVMLADRAAAALGTRRVFLLADKYREGIEVMATRLVNIELVRPECLELGSDLDRSPDGVMSFIRDWQTALAARTIVALDGPTSLLHPARAQGACIWYA